jgi:lysophospholipase L1-like esterase
MKRMPGALIATLAVGASAWLLASSLRAQSTSSPRWVTSWATSQQVRAEATVSNGTVRMIARTTIGGTRVRVRLDNTFGGEPLVIGRAFVGHRLRGALVAPGSNTAVLFNGKPDVTVAPGGTVTSDAVPLRVLARQDLAVSLFVPGAQVHPSQHTGALVTSYRTPDGAGDVAATDAAAPFTQTTTSLWWLKAVDVAAEPLASAVVAFGDSITDGTCATLDAHDRWEDIVSTRLILQQSIDRGAGARQPPLAIVNEGIGGNTLTREGLNPPADSTPGLERLERDVLSHHGVGTVVLFMGTNDIRRGAPAAQVIQAMTTIAQKVKASGARIIGVTIIPRHAQPAGSATPWTDANTRTRNDVNDWIRSRAPFDAVIDFSKVVADPSNADRLLPAFNCGDGIHPSPRGYFEMGQAVDLRLLRK